ncbi:hypothetical protein [Limosilactobacillus caecicola]|uniref:hypothetical protein n=1 Tax=Limosilactobacillus caecicola TaxID=2941332 RepID=UPI00203D039C|nr:hypothetical protein [Limosilactobacillus caecicola]
MKSTGFILSEQIVALAIIVMAVMIFTITTRGLISQQQRMQDRLVAARLVKEYVYSHHTSTVSGYSVHQDSSRVIEVWKDHQKVLELKA